MENQRKYRKIILLLFLQNVEEERFLLLSNPKTGGKLVENWRKTGGKRNVLVLSVSMEIQAKMKT